MKHTKKALLMSALSMLLCLTMLVGSTFAWFTDTVTAGKNRIVAGNLDVELEYATFNEDNSFKEWTKVTKDTSLFKKETLWEPGHTEVVYLKISNLGSLALKYQLSVDVNSQVEGKSVEIDEDTKAPKVIKLSEHLKFGQVVTSGKNANGELVAFTPFATRKDAIDEVKDSATELQKFTHENKKLVAAKDKEDKSYDYVALVVYMPEDVGNEANYRGDTAPSIDLGITLVATQVDAEIDSFGNDYDAKVKYPIVGTAAVNDDRSVTITIKPSGEDVSDNDAIVLTSPAGSLKDGVEKVDLKVEESKSQNIINITASQLSKTFDITAIDQNGNGDILNDGYLFTYKQNVGANLSKLEVYHNSTIMTKDEVLSGEADHYIYDKDTGVVIMSVSHFSPFTFVYSDGNVVETPTEIVDALNSAVKGDKLILPANQYELPPEFQIKEGVTITGNSGSVLNVSGGGKDITTPNPETGITQGLLLKNDNVTISGVTISGDVSNATGDKYSGYNSLVRITGNNVTIDNVTMDSSTNDSPIVIANTSGDNNIIIIKDCKLTAAYKAIHMVDGTKGTVIIDGCDIDAVYPFNVNTNSTLTLSIKNSNLKGFVSYGPSVTKAVFEGCKIGIGHGQRYLVAYADTEFINCEFGEGYLAQTKNNHTKTMTFTNCTKNGVKLTAENLLEQFHADNDSDSIDTANGWTVIVDGEQVLPRN